MSILWTSLAKRGLEPSIPVKFAIALVGVGAGFLFLIWGSTFAGAGNNFQVGLWWLAGLYLIQSLAELCISPVGLSMITKLSIARIVGLMMGVWFLATSVGNYIGGRVSSFYESWPLPNLFGAVAAFGIVAGLVLLVLVKPIRRLTETSH
jgi:POT family proton-dependent oligopeptide transporter